MTMPTTSVLIAGVSVVSSALEGITITYGRQRVNEAFTPGAATISLLTNTGAWNWKVGDSVQITSTIGASSWQRFAGTITSVSVGKYVSSVVATSNVLGLMARVPTDDFTANPSGTRPKVKANLEAVMSDSALAGIPYAFDTGYVDLQSDIVLSASNALDVCQQIAAWDTYGLLYEDQFGNLYYDAYRTATTASWSLSASEMFESWSAHLDMTGLVNQVTITYATDRTFRVSDWSSIGAYGYFGTTRSIFTDNLSDAQTAGYATIGAGAEPRWQMTGIGFDLAYVSAGRTASWLGSTVGTVINASALTSAVVGMPTKVVLEGWTEQIYQDSHLVEMYLSDVYQTLRPQTWNEVTPSLVWSSVTPASTRWKDLYLGTTL